MDSLKNNEKERYSAGDFIVALPPYLGGYLYAYSPQCPFLIAVLTMLILAILVVRSLRSKEPIWAEILRTLLHFF